MLFFGCRHPDQDYLYADELKAFAADGITELHTAFSRGEGPKTYVQNLVAAQKDRVWSLIEQGAIIYVCGDGGKMEPDVKAALVAIYRERKRRRCGGRRSAGSTISAPRTATCSTSGRAGRTFGRPGEAGPIRRVASRGGSSTAAIRSTQRMVVGRSSSRSRSAPGGGTPSLARVALLAAVVRRSASPGGSDGRAACRWCRSPSAGRRKARDRRACRPSGPRAGRPERPA